MNTIFGFALVLGVLILVHEWGHYIVARIFGVRVDVFSIGFGPRLFGFKRGATDWRISAVPLGGYVRMAGQDLSEIDSSDTKPTGAPDELMSKPRWQRALISFAGPAVNLIFPIFLLAGFFVFKGEPYPKYNDSPLVIVDLEGDSPLMKAGVVKGDRVVALNGAQNPTWGSAEAFLGKEPAPATLQISVEHEGQRRDLEVSTAEMKTPALVFGFPPDTPLVAEAQKKRPAYEAGIRRHDVVQGIDGQPIVNWNQMVNAIQKSDGKTLHVVVLRDGKPMAFDVTPERGKNETGASVWMLGIGRGQDFSFRHVNVGQAFRSAADFAKAGSFQVLGVVKRLVTGQMSAKQLQSVIGIANEAGHAVQEGTFAVVILMAGLSLNLAILNLLPIPILDGGNILLLSMEGLRRRDFSLAFKERFIQVGLVFLLVLFAYVMYNDVVRLLPSHS
jgi:regulator of sigma E protease